MCQMKEQDITLEKELNEVEINNLPHNGFEVTIIKILTKLRRRKDEHRISIKSYKV